MNCETMCRLRAPKASFTPISFVRSFTTTYMMFATPIPATSSVNAPTSPRNTSMPKPIWLVSFSSSMKSHIGSARSSSGSNL